MPHRTKAPVSEPPADDHDLNGRSGRLDASSLYGIHVSLYVLSQNDKCGYDTLSTTGPTDDKPA